MRRRDWAMVSLGFYTSPSHYTLSLSAQAIGPLLFVLANRDTRAGCWGRLTPKDGLSVAQRVARHMRTLTAAEVELAIAELVEAGTAVREGEAIVFPAFEAWQKPPKSAAADAAQGELFTPSPQSTGPAAPSENDSPGAPIEDQKREENKPDAPKGATRAGPKPAAGSRRTLERHERTGGASTLAARPVAEVLGERPTVAPERTEDVRAAIRAQLGLRVERAPPSAA